MSWHKELWWKSLSMHVWLVSCLILTRSTEHPREQGRLKVAVAEYTDSMHIHFLINYVTFLASRYLKRFVHIDMQVNRVWCFYHMLRKVEIISKSTLMTSRIPMRRKWSQGADLACFYLVVYEYVCIFILANRKKASDMHKHNSTRFFLLFIQSCNHWEVMNMNLQRQA